MRNPLRTFAFSFFFILFALNLHSQWVSIPDTNFGKWLNYNGYSPCLQGNSATGWQIDTTCGGVFAATNLHMGYAGIRSLQGIIYFKSLKHLICLGNSIKVVPELPATLIQLDCRQNPIDTIYPVPAQLKTFICQQAGLNHLPQLPVTLEYLDCSYNNLTALPPLPPNLKQLRAYNNYLTALPVLPATLVSVDCNSNLISTLPALPDSLEGLACNTNLLDSLPSLPKKLRYLDCIANNLVSLPDLPKPLSTLYCSRNNLLTLPQLPDSLRVMYAELNNLTWVPELPDTMNTLAINWNPILCLPKIKKIAFFYWDSTNVSCMPNYGEVGYSSPSLTHFPLCNLPNANGCGIYWNISGNQYSDANNNCLKDTAEYFVNNVTVQLKSNGVLEKEMLTVYGGYSFVTEAYGTYTVSVDTTNLPFMVSCPANNIYSETITVSDSLHGSRNFGITCKPGFDLAAWSIAGGFVPANIRPVNITAGDATNFYNAHCAAGISGSVTLSYTGPVQFAGSAPNALIPAISGNTLSWNIADFGNVNFFTDFDMVFHTDTTAQIGQQVCFTLTVNPIAGDNNPANNVLTHCFTVVASYDPNDKTAYPAGNIDTAQKELTYTIRFQNTGTAEAQHIYITDTLDTDVDASTFQLLAYSHQPMVQLKENAVRFNFPNINLPDSNTNEPLSHGYVQYKVKLKPNLPIGTVINNTAYIYFDFNAPVVTNTTTNTISLNTGIQAASHEPLAFRMFPNPSNGSVTISVDERLIGSTATISDITGRAVAVVPLTTQHSTLTTTTFSSGVYFVTLGNRTQKLVIQY